MSCKSLRTEDTQQVPGTDRARWKQPRLQVLLGFQQGARWRVTWAITHLGPREKGGGTTARASPPPGLGLHYSFCLEHPSPLLCLPSSHSVFYDSVWASVSPRSPQMGPPPLTWLGWIQPLCTSPLPRRPPCIETVWFPSGLWAPGGQRPCLDPLSIPRAEPSTQPNQAQEERSPFPTTPADR